MIAVRRSDLTAVSRWEALCFFRMIGDRRQKATGIGERCDAAPGIGDCGEIIRLAITVAIDISVGR